MNCSQAFFEDPAARKIFPGRLVAASCAVLWSPFSLDIQESLSFHSQPNISPCCSGHFFLISAQRSPVDILLPCLPYIAASTWHAFSENFPSPHMTVVFPLPIDLEKSTQLKNLKVRWISGKGWPPVCGKANFSLWSSDLDSNCRRM